MLIGMVLFAILGLLKMRKVSDQLAATGNAGSVGSDE